MGSSDVVKGHEHSVEEKTELLSAVCATAKPEIQNGEDDKSKKRGFSFINLSRKGKLTFLALCVMKFCACVCFSLPAPFFPHEAQKKGVSKTTIGFIFSTFELVVFLSSPIFGSLLISIGPMFLSISGVILCGVCAILFGLLDQCPSGNVFIAMCFLCRSVEALGSSAFLTSSYAIIANSFPDNLATVFGTIESFCGMGYMVGPPIGGVLYELGGFGMPFWVLGTTLLVCAAVSCYIMPHHTDSVKSYQGSILTLLRSPLIWLASFSIFCASFIFGYLQPLLADHLIPFNLSTWLVGLVFLCNAGMYGITASFWGWLSDTKGWIKSPMVIGNSLTCVSLLLLGPSPLLPFLPHELWLIIVSLLLTGTFLSCSIIPSIKCLLQGAKEIGFEDNINTYGLVSGCFTSAFSLGMFTGPTVGALLTQYCGFKWSATFCAGLLLLAAIFMSIYCSFKSGCLFCKTVCSCCLDDSFQIKYVRINERNGPRNSDLQSVVYTKQTNE